jgi:hypothetical protein
MTNEMQPINQNAILDQQLTSAGSTGARTATGLASSVSTGFLFAVAPAAPTPTLYQSKMSPTTSSAIWVTSR